MTRSRALLPAAPDLLEARVVLSQVYFSPPTGLVGAGVAEVSTGTGAHLRIKVASMVERTILGNGLVQMTNIVSSPIGAGGVLTSMVVHAPDGTTRTVDQTATTYAGTTNYSQAILLPDGSHETETGIEVTQPSTATIQPDGTLLPHSGGRSASQVTVFRRIVTETAPTQASGLIVGSTVTQAKSGRVVASTDEQVTNLDGSQMEVRVLRTIRNGTTTDRETIINYATGAVSTTTSTSRITSST